MSSSSGVPAPTSEYTDPRSPRRPLLRMVQNFLVVWLDRNIDENDEHYQHSVTKLREISNTVSTFTDVDQCIDFITDLNAKKIFMIISDETSEPVMTIIHDVTQIDTIYLFGVDQTPNQTCTQQSSKIQGSFTHMTTICEALNTAVHKCDRNTISMGFVPKDGDITGKNLDELDQSFMYTQILKEILLTIDFQPKHFTEFINYCRQQFHGNPAELRNVDKLENEYCRHTPIWWYTYQYFLYSMLNCALRTMEMDPIIKLGFFVRDLHEHITQLHSEQYLKNQHSKSFVVYRGQGLSQTGFDQLVKIKGGLLSFNNFLSTSTSPSVSFAFAESVHSAPNLVGVLFQITIDSSIESTPFANISDVSQYKDEEEILFSMHSIFRIGEMKEIDGNNRLWQVDLILTDDHDPQLHLLTQHIREETFPDANGWDRLGQLLIELGEFDKAEEVYDALFDQCNNENRIANIYHRRGVIKRGLGEYAEAIRCYEKAIEMEEINSPTHQDLLASYSGIGLVYKEMCNYSKALSFHQKVLEIRGKTLPPNHPDLAISYSNIGSVYLEMSEYSKALSFHQKALEIFEKTFPPNHPSLATSYNNIGLLYNKIGEYSKAFSFLQKALEIQEKTLPSNHPHLATSYNNIGLVYRKMGEYSKALSFHQKTLEISEKTLPPNHPNLAISYCNIGLVYDEMGEYSKALSFHQKALEIRGKSLPPNHPSLATSYSNISSAYEKMGEYSKAFSFLQKALEIQEKTLPSNHPHLATSYNNIGLVYRKMDEYSKALAFLQKAFEIFEKTLSPNHPSLAASYGNIGSVYLEMGEYSKALSFLQKALEIFEKTLLPNHPHLAISHSNIGLVYEKMDEYSKALSSFQRALNIVQQSLPPNHPHLQVLKNNVERIKRKF